MELVEPIRDRKKITQIKNLLGGAHRYRDLLLFVVGINSALRVSDLLALCIGDFVDTEGTIRTDKVVREAKRGKRNVVTVNTSIREALETYLSAYQGIEKNPAHYLFFSTKHANYDYTCPLSRERAWQVIREACKAVGLPGNYGTHTLRKTWGYHARKSGVPMEIIMEKLNHANFAFTKRYLGITDDELKAAAEGLNL
ncbi:MAG: tyrosine-type recombinase/integrase [Aggregatilineales bacterium]